MQKRLLVVGRLGQIGEYVYMDNQPAHPFSFFGRPAGKILWTNGNLRLTASTGVTRNSASREDSDHKGRVKEEAGRINYIALVFLSSTSRMNMKKGIGLLAGT